MFFQADLRSSCMALWGHLYPAALRGSVCPSGGHVTVRLGQRNAPRPAGPGRVRAHQGGSGPHTEPLRNPRLRARDGAREVSREPLRTRMHTHIQKLESVTLEEARAYLALAKDDEEPDEQEIHHALFMLRKAFGLEAPSFDALRIALKNRHAA